MTMNKGRLFWGSFLLGLGALVLLDRSGTLVIEWGGIWAYWPVLLILIGISVLGGSGILGRVASVLTGLLAAALVVAFLNFGGWHGDEREGKDAVLTEAMRAGTTRAAFSLDAGVGTFMIGGSGGPLMEARIDSDPWTYSVDRDSSEDQDQVRLWMDHHDGTTWGWKVRNTVKIGLNPSPAWDINVDAGAARVDADLRNLAVEQLRLSSGASTIKVQLGARAEECTVMLETGVSSVRIYVPESVGCDVRIEAPMSAKRLPGFEKRGDGWYETDNFATASRKIHLDIDAGVSSIRVLRVADGEGVDL
jgi:hypothetical protein